MYPRQDVSEFISRNFIPVKIHIKEQPQTFDRFNAQWTPILVVLDSDGVEHHRFEGYLPPREFLAQLELGLAHAAFARKNWEDAERRYRAIVERFDDTDAAPEALYWTGVSKYKASHDPGALAQTAQQFKQRYQESAWAKKSSVWAA